MWRFKLVDWTFNDFNIFLEELCGSLWADIISLIVFTILIIFVSSMIILVVKTIKDFF